MTEHSTCSTHSTGVGFRALSVVADAQRAQPWPEPQPWPKQEAALPYPFEALPTLMRDAIEEHRASAQQPVELVAASALSAASLASQHIADVRRDAGLVGPIGLFSIVLAESGERKSTADKAMGSRTLEAAVVEMGEAMKVDLAARAAKRDAWEDEIAGIRAAIKRDTAARKEEDQARVPVLRARLEQLLEAPPPSPIAPRLFFEDETSENLKAGMALGWPSGGLWSDEGGLIVGSRGMSDDTALGMFTTLNRLWDGGVLQSGRRTMQSYRATGRRFTTCLMMQPAVFDRLMSVAGGTARASGLLARFLIARPASTAGTRLYVPQAPAAVSTFWHERLRELAKAPLPTTADNLELRPPELELTPEAFEAWRSYHDQAESELARGRSLADVRDIGAKSAENAARIAAVFHLVEHGPVGATIPIAEATMIAASGVAAWHLFEANRVFDAGDIEEAVLDAEAVVRCCLDPARRTRERIAQYVGRRRLRGRAGRQLREEAIEFAIDVGWLRLVGTTLEPHPRAFQEYGDG